MSEFYGVNDLSNNNNTVTYYGYSFDVREDNNAGICNIDFTNAAGTEIGIVVNHNHYIDGPIHYERNHELTMYVKDNNNDGEYIKESECEMNVSHLLQGLQHFKPHEHNQTFDFSAFAINALEGNYDNNAVSDYVTIHKLVNIPAAVNSPWQKQRVDETYKKYREMWYGGMLPREWQGIIRKPYSIYYITINNIDNGYL
jgi:hypothetical protein